LAALGFFASVDTYAWVSIALLAVLLAPVTFPDPRAKWLCGVYVFTVLLVQVYPHDNWAWVSFGATWAAAAAFLASRNTYAISTLAIVCASLSYLAGRVAGADFSATYTGFPYLLSGNIFAIIAILYAGWRGGTLIDSQDVDSANLRVGWLGHNSFRYFGRGCDLRSREKDSAQGFQKEIGASDGK
jgi:hypothetical protein